jgi:hypothetical protein
MLDLFKVAAKEALALLGEGSFLRGDVSCQVNIEHGVQLEGFDFNPTQERYLTVERDVATIDASHDPKVGDTLSHPDGEFVLDVLLQDAGPVKRFVLRKG